MNDESPELRLDKWLWAARFFKTRHLAVDAINGGKIEVNGQRTKPGRTVRPGARLDIHKGSLVWEIEVLAIDRQRRSATEAARLYREDETSRLKREALVCERPGQPPNRPPLQPPANSPAPAPRRWPRLLRRQIHQPRRPRLLRRLLPRLCCPQRRQHPRRPRPRLRPPHRPNPRRQRPQLRPPPRPLRLRHQRGRPPLHPLRRHQPLRRHPHRLRPQRSLRHHRHRLRRRPSHPKGAQDHPRRPSPRRHGHLRLHPLRRQRL